MVKQYSPGEIVYYVHFPRNAKKNENGKIIGHVDIGVINNVRKDGVSNIYEFRYKNGHVYSTHRVFDTYNDAVNAFKDNKN